MKLKATDKIVVSAESLERIKALVAELEASASASLRELDYTMPDGTYDFEFEWDWNTLPDGRIVLDNCASYPDNLGYPYLTGNSDLFSDLLDEHNIEYTDYADEDD